VKRLVLATALILGACVASGVRVTEEQAKQFERGKATYNEVVSKLGQPTSSVVTGAGLRYISYAFVEAAARPETYIPIAGAFIGGADARSNIATFSFDGRGVLVDYTIASSQTGMALGAGANVQRTPDQPAK
jgi:hypothetical protein